MVSKRGIIYFKHPAITVALFVSHQKIRWLTNALFFCKKKDINRTFMTAVSVISKSGFKCALSIEPGRGLSQSSKIRKLQDGNSMSLTILLPFIFFSLSYKSHSFEAAAFLLRAQTPHLLKSVFQANCFNRPSNLQKTAPAYLHIVSPGMFIKEIYIYTIDATVQRPASEGIFLMRLVNGVVQRLEGSIQCLQGRIALAGPRAGGRYWMGSQGFQWPLNEGLRDRYKKLKSASGSTEK